MTTPSRAKASPGFTLLETLLSMAILALGSLAILSAVEGGSMLAVKAREKTSGQRLLQMGISRLKNIDFYFLFSADSARPDFGLYAAYPYRKALADYGLAVQSAGFDRFTIAIEFLRRDGSDGNGNGLVSELVPYEDSDGDRVDDLDPAVRFRDANLDGDHYDTFASAGRTVAEQPDTHMKRVTLALFKRGRTAASQAFLVSREQFTGLESPSSEAGLTLLVSTPSNMAVLYSLQSPAQQAAFSLAISKPYPAGVTALRADVGQPLLLSGETAALASVAFHVNGSGALASLPSDMLGLFWGMPYPVTAALAEGMNTLHAIATKDTFSSPIAPREVLLDIRPPVVAGASPLGQVADRSPFVGAFVTDPAGGQAASSGVCPDVLAMRVNGSTVPFSYDAAAGRAAWIDPATGLPPALGAGTYVVELEAGDYALYKASAAWSFTVSPDGTDPSAPVVAQKAPIGTASSLLPEISAKVFDPQSGIDPLSIVVRLDGAVVVSSANASAAYDALAQQVSFTPPADLAAGSYHTVELEVRHWADQPTNKVFAYDSWGFWVQP